MGYWEDLAIKSGFAFVQDCSANNVHIAKDGKAACNSRFKVFTIKPEHVSYIGCTRCAKKIEKLEN